MSKSLILHILLEIEWLTSWQSYLEYRGIKLLKPFPTCHAEWTQDCSLTWLFYRGLTVWWHSVFFPKNRCSNYTSHLFKWPSQVTFPLLQSQSNHIQRSACSKLSMTGVQFNNSFFPSSFSGSSSPSPYCRKWGKSFSGLRVKWMQ